MANYGIIVIEHFQWISCTTCTVYRLQDIYWESSVTIYNVSQMSRCIYGELGRMPMQRSFNDKVLASTNLMF